MPPKLGIIAGGGELPRHLVRYCQSSGRPCFIAVLDGQKDQGDFSDVPHATFRLGAAGAVVKRLKAEQAQALIFAGHVNKPPLTSLRLDMWAANFLLKTGVFNKGDDSFLSALIKALESEGFDVIGADDVDPDLLVGEGCQTEQTPGGGNLDDIATGMAAAKTLGARDEGQAVVAANGQVIGREDRRGTDAMLDDLPQAQTGAKGRSGVLVKMMKPNQERRVDLPTIGPDTIERAARAGLAGIAVSAGNALMLQREDTLQAAERTGLFIIGMPTAAPETQ